jgi:hypothetical protein
MGLGRTLRRGFEKATGSLGNYTEGLSTQKGIQETLYHVSGLSLLATPVAYLGGLQQGGWKGGIAKAEGAMGDPNEFWSDPANRSMMAMTAAEIAAIALSGGSAAGALGVGGTAGVSLGAGPAALAALPGAGVALAAGAGIQGQEALRQQAAEERAANAPPDINEFNDPDTAAQFQRIRKAARMLGRSGTIKNKGKSASVQTLGGGADGEQTLGTQLAVA